MKTGKYSSAASFKPCKRCPIPSKCAMAGKCLLKSQGLFIFIRTKAEKIAAAKKRHGFTAVNKPRRGGPKKFEVLAVEGNEVKKVNFGDPNMTIKKNTPSRKASYCARSGGIKGKNSKLSANYWSRRAWDC